MQKIGMIGFDKEGKTKGKKMCIGFMDYLGTRIVE